VGSSRSEGDKEGFVILSSGGDGRYGGLDNTGLWDGELMSGGRGEGTVLIGNTGDGE
jgi:hypothetical protein